MDVAQNYAITNLLLLHKIIILQGKWAMMVSIVHVRLSVGFSHFSCHFIVKANIYLRYIFS